MIIYKTTNLINGKIYVGQDSHNNPDYLGSGKLIQKAIKKYNKKNFKKEVLCKCKTKEELNEKEIYWIKKLKSQNRNIGYNITDGGLGITMTKTIKKRISIKIKKHFEDINNIKMQSDRMKKYYQKHPEKIKLFQTKLKKLYEEHPEKRKEMSKLKKQYYKEHPELKKHLSKIKKKLFINNPILVENIRKRSCKRIYKYDKEWNLLDEYSSIKEAAQKNNLHYTTIGHSCRQKTIRGGFHWSFDKK